MPKSHTHLSKSRHLKSDTKEIELISTLFNGFFKIIRFILNHPIKAITLGLGVQMLGSRTNALSGKCHPEADQEDRTMLLHIAADAGYLPDVKKLVKGGADIHAKDDNDMTPLDVACDAAEDYSSIINYLESQGARSYCTSFQHQAKETSAKNDEPTVQSTQRLKL